MSEFRRPQIVKTKDLRVPNYYTTALDGEFAEFAFNEERALTYKGEWRSQVYQKSDEFPLDLEIGTGVGVHFQHHALKHPERGLLGIELKYKPLIQTIRGALRKGAKNARIMRLHAFNIDMALGEQELNDVFIHFPDPWTSPHKPKNRLVNPRMMDLLFKIQRPGSRLDFKTDSRDMFLWAMEFLPSTPYKIEFQTLDLHSSPLASENVITGFEKIFIKQGIQINFVRLRRP
jgi:tRNA (guanine-N7-)-methyltransferase